MSNIEVHAPHLGVSRRPVSHERKKRPNGADKQQHQAQQPGETIALFGAWICRRLAEARDISVWSNLTNVLVDAHALGDLDGVVLRRFLKQCPHENLKHHLRQQLGKKALDALLGPVPQESNSNGRSSKFRGRGREPHSDNGSGATHL